MMGLLLLIIACTILCILLIPAILVGTVISCLKWNVNLYYYNIALSLDQLGNVICQHLFNLVLIKGEEAYLFGNIDETLSSVIGKNKQRGTLTKLGAAVARGLNKLDPNHVEDAIDNNYK